MSLETPSVQQVNFGPYHPSIRGMLRFMLDLDGEVIQKSVCYAGFTHKGFEKILENKPLLHVHKMIEKIDQDFLTPYGFSYAFVLNVEKMLDIQPALRGQFVRVILAEMGRILCHLNYMMTITESMGFSFITLWCASIERKIDQIFLELKEQHSLFLVPGGVTADLSSGLVKEVVSLTKELDQKISHVKSILLNNAIFKLRTIQVGVVSEVDALSWGLSGPNLRASRVTWDLRRTRPYDIYDQLDFKIPVGTYGDSFERTAIRVEEIIQSSSIIRQCIDFLPQGDVYNRDSDFGYFSKDSIKRSTQGLINHYKKFSEGIRLPSLRSYVSIEGGRGELGLLLSSRGSPCFDRVRLRAPGFFNLQALEALLRGHSFSDIPTLLASFDIYSAEVDR